MKKPRRLTHMTPAGAARMVDVGAKRGTGRTARAEAIVRVGRRIADLLEERGGIAKGNVIETARVAGIMAAKRTSDLIPMCHPLPLDVVAIRISVSGDCVRIESHAACRGVTGVEMEALVAAATAALTVYDMCKSADKGIVIERVRLLEKTGGKSGRWLAPGARPSAKPESA